MLKIFRRIKKTLSFLACAVRANRRELARQVPGAESVCVSGAKMISGSMCKYFPEVNRMVISSNCQTAGITAAMQVLFPRASIEPFPIAGDLSIEEQNELQKKLGDVDVWVTSSHPEWPGQWGLGQIKVVKIPQIRFWAFHPDLTYARNQANGQLVSSNIHYNSVIVLWAWTRALDVKDTARMFSETVLRKLGYMNVWPSQVEEMRMAFAHGDIDFKKYFYRIKRLGVFMNSVNHPVQAVTHQIAIQVASLIDPKLSEWDIEQMSMLTDSLRHTIWPVYPPIAEALSVKGSYIWRIGEVIYPTLEKYIEYAFSIYQAESISKKNVSSTAELKRKFSILDAELRRRR